MNKKIIFLSVLMLIFVAAKAQNSDANIIGHVVCNGEHLPFVNVVVKGTTIGTATDVTGHYQLNNMPVGDIVLVADAIGYKPQEIEIKTEKDNTSEIHFDLKEDVLGLEEVVITGDRNAVNRKESTVITTAITPKMAQLTQSEVLAQSLNFCPGLRVENDCQNCGFTQLRMNGLEGPYSQVLINGRPIFSGLAGVYGLEMIPSNMVEQIEVVRGGGSALYGSNAIAGTVNIILKEPIKNSFEFGYTSGMIGLGYDNPAFTNEVNANASVVSSDNTAGMSLFAFCRDNQPFDANDDSYSEISELKNVTFGSNLFYRPSNKNKLSADIFVINENRRGGNKFNSVEHESDIAESVKHGIYTGALTFDQYLKGSDKISIFVSSMYINRDSYYGANQDMSAYGNTKNMTYDAGVNYVNNWDEASLVAGIENQGEWLKDMKLGYPDFENAVILNNEIIGIPHTENTTVANQNKNTTGVYAQLEYEFARFKVSGGLRYDHYNIQEKVHNGEDISGDVLSPRLNLLFDLNERMQFRANYSSGYRAPQIFDEDLHIETSGARRVIHENADNLKQENSHSLMASLDFHNEGKVNYELLIEGFYTLLLDPFANEYGEPDSLGTVVYTRVNSSSNAVVQGVNMEFTIFPSSKINATLGFTIQSSMYGEKQEDFNSRNFYRTPNDYGFFIVDWSPTKKFSASLSGNYTGKMYVPYFGVSLDDPDAGVLRESDPFFDLGVKFSYDIKLKGSKLQLYCGMKNIFNSYQSDFDKGIDRDPGYIYGPGMPRYPYAGMKFFIN